MRSRWVINNNPASEGFFSLSSRTYNYKKITLLRFFLTNEELWFMQGIFKRWIYKYINLKLSSFRLQKHLQSVTKGKNILSILFYFHSTNSSHKPDQILFMCSTIKCDFTMWIECSQYIKAEVYNSPLNTFFCQLHEWVGKKDSEGNSELSPCDVSFPVGLLYPD